jgi:VanZ family protein
MTNALQKSKWRGRLIRYTPLFLWVAVIFFASSSQGSMSRTSYFVRPLLEFLFPNAPEETLIVYHGYIRKLAHLVEYAILAFWSSRAFCGSSNKVLHRFWFLVSLLLVLLVASIDEYNQSFNTLRTGSIYDILIDVLGGAFMIVFLTFYKSAHNK